MRYNIKNCERSLERLADTYNKKIGFKFGDWKLSKNEDGYLIIEIVSQGEYATPFTTARLKAYEFCVLCDALVTAFERFGSVERIK